MRWLSIWHSSRTGISQGLQRLAAWSRLNYTDAGQGRIRWRGRLPRSARRFLHARRWIGVCRWMARLASRISAAQVN